MIIKDFTADLRLLYFGVGQRFTTEGIKELNKGYLKNINCIVASVSSFPLTSLLVTSSAILFFVQFWSHVLSRYQLHFILYILLLFPPTVSLFGLTVLCKYQTLLK